MKQMANEGNEKKATFTSANMSNTKGVKEAEKKVEKKKIEVDYSNNSKGYEHKINNARVLVGLVMIVCVTMLIMSGVSKKNNDKKVTEEKKVSESTKSDSKESSTKSSKSKENVMEITHTVVEGKRVPYNNDKELKLNVEYILKDENGEYSLIVEGVRLADEKNRDYTGNDMKQIMYLDYKYKNINSKKYIEFCTGELKLTGDDNSELKFYITSYEKDKYAKDIAAGEERNVSILYGLSKDYKNLKLVLSAGYPKKELGEFVVPTGL